MAEKVASLYAEISVKIDGLTSGLNEAKSALTQTSQNLTRFSGSFNDAFIGAVGKGSVSMQGFGATLLQTGSDMGLTTRDISRMASATGIFTDRQLAAGNAAANVAAKASELSRAVQAGTMTTKEAGEAFKSYAAEQLAAADTGRTFAETVTTIATTMAKVGAAAFAVGKIIEQAFDWGEQGAAILQTDKSFNLMLTTIGAAPETFEELRAAARGTVSDMELMGSASTLLIGTTGELGKSFADALPELMGIAQAAHTLNPTLGDTTFLFDSLARGIKRGSPLILDNLGIIVKLEDVYATYAETLGKSADQLTKTEQAQALLNEVLRQGKSMTDLAAEATVDAALSIDQMNTAIDNAKDALLTKLAPAMGKAADAITEYLTAADKIKASLADNKIEVLETATSYEEYATELEQAAKAGGFVVDSQGRLGTSSRGLGNVVGQVADETYKLSEADWELARATILAGGSATDFIASLKTVEEEVPKTTEEVDRSAQRWSEYSDAVIAAKEAQEELTASLNEQVLAAGLAAGLQGTLGAAMLTYAETMLPLEAEHQKLTEQLQTLESMGYSPTSLAVQELNTALGLNAQAQREAGAATDLATSKMIFQQASAGLNTQSALDLARTMGILSEADYAVASATEMVRQSFDTNSDSLISAAEAGSGFVETMAYINEASQNLIKAGLPFEMSDIFTEAEKLAKTDAATPMEEAATAAEEGVTPLDDFAEASQNSADKSEINADKTDEMNKQFNIVKTSSANAKGGLDTLKPSVTNIEDPLKNAGTAAGNLADAMGRIPRSTSVKITGVDNAIRELDRLAVEISSFPTSLTVHVKVVQTQGTALTSSSVVEPQYQYNLASAPAVPAVLPEVTTINIYNPLAASMLLEERKQVSLARAMRRM